MGKLRQARARREMQRRLRELDRLDRQHGLGAMPRSSARLRRRSGRMLLRIVAGSAVAALAVVALVGLDHRLQPHRLLPVVAAPSVPGPYTFLDPGADGIPTTYDPCHAIHYVINPDGAPADYLQFIQSAVAAAQSASGFEFVYDGPSTDRWASRQTGARRRPVLITFNSPSEVPTLAGPVVGLGGSTTRTVSGGKVRPRYVTGSVALDAPWFRHASATHEEAAERAIVMHELGHVLGLGHVQDKSQLMFADMVGQLAYGKGDLAGLAALGAVPCG